MPNPATSETTASLQSSDILFVMPFGVESDIHSTAIEVANQFRTVSTLARVITYLTTHNPDAVEPSLGVLDRHFALNRRYNNPSTIPNVRIAPMGASEEGVLLGSFRSSYIEPEEALNLFGVGPPENHHGFMYATIDTLAAQAAGFGLMSMRGKVTTFAERPSDDELIDLTNGQTSAAWSSGKDFPLCRIDVTSEQAQKEWNYRLSQRHPV